MGIAYSLIRVTPETVDDLRGRPRAVAQFVYGDANLCEEKKPSLLSRLFGRPASVDDGAVPERRDDDEDDLDKAWHIVHYLLTGETNVCDSALNLIADETDKLADIDLGLGPPFVIPSAKVSAFALAADKVSDEAFLSRLVPDEIPLAELYLGDSVRDDPEDMAEYALEKFHILRNFAHAASARGEAVITYYC